MTGLIKAHHQTADVSEILSYTMQLLDYTSCFLIMRLNSARMPDASPAALLIVLFDPSNLLDITGHCSVAPRMCFEVRRQRSHGTLWQALIFQVPLMDFSDRDLRCSGEYYPLLAKDAKERRFYNILLPEIPDFREESSP